TIRHSVKVRGPPVLPRGRRNNAGPGCPLSVVVDIAAIIAPLCVIAGIGFAWGGSSQHFDTNMVGMLTVNFGVPCLIFSTLTRLQVPVEAFGAIAGLFTLALVISAVVAVVALRLMRLDIFAFLPGTVFPNNGNMGLP